MKFIIDMPLSPVLSHWLTEVGHDAVHASSIGLFAASDVEIIDCARQEGRTVVTGQTSTILASLRLQAATAQASFFSEAATGPRRVSEPGSRRFYLP
ncbi:putative nuclease of putative toxin-antitoxin system [Bradyrhizobium yuanmingense]|uniref:DUF5615 family PIN-like protein n=1 Tax=Bradyrhizobium yuanmingense TaxID=108015 RepID=UPI00351715D5